MTTGLIIGRFQPFHIGHYNTIKTVIDQGKLDKVIIGVGSAQLENELENPFNYDERKLMIKLSFEKKDNVEVFPIIDINDYDKWVEHVVKIVPHFDYVLTNNKITKELFEKEGYYVKNLPVKNIISGTEIRELIATDNDYSDLLPEGTKIIVKEVKGTDKIKRIYKKAYRNPTPATDVIIELYQREGGKYRGVVFVERRNPPYGMALPGGFHEYGLSAEENIIKEAKEETGLDIKIDRQLGIYSDPKRDPRKHIISTVFVAKAFGSPKAGDDAQKVFVFQERDVSKLNLVFDHNKIIKDYLGWNPKWRNGYYS